MTRVLIVDDEAAICELLTLTLQRMGSDPIAVRDISQAKQLLQEKTFDLCLTDYQLPDGNGIELVEHIQSQYPNMPVAVITAHGNMETAVKALKAGAFDFVSKPVDLPLLKELIQSALKVSEIPKDQPSALSTEVDLIGESPMMQNLKNMITKVARSQAPVYISGPSGSGKERVARCIHQQGPRANAPFIPVNCGAIPSELMESEFFGHLKGSFTGATQDKQGLFQAADQGTLFLDEVADLPLSMQVKLLRAIQEKSIRAIGAQQEQHVDIRLLSATHKNLADEVAAGRFREDLFYRLNVIEITVPPLSQRPDDIPLLADHILNKITAKNKLEQANVLSKTARQALCEYPFPGNIRELENILERAVALCENHSIEVADLQLPEVSASSQPESADSGSLQDDLEELEKARIVAALEKTKWNKTKAAKELGITFRALRYRLKKLGLE